MKKIVLLVLFTTLTGCSSFSTTALRCGVDRESSYVEIVSAPQGISQNVRAYAELCSFAYQEQSE